MALIGHLRVANECRAASATLIATSSGPIPKAPGSAGGYLLYLDAFAAKKRVENRSLDNSYTGMRASRSTLHLIEPAAFCFSWFDSGFAE